jgi:DNA binding domain, excisionase family
VNTPLDDTYLTVAEVVAIMRVSKMTVYRLVGSGELPAKRIGRSLRIPRSALSSYLDGADAHPAPHVPATVAPMATRSELAARP